MKFHERFDIDIDIEEAKERFVFRAKNLFDQTFSRPVQRDIMLSQIATAVGRNYIRGKDFLFFVESDFLDTLRALEVAYNHEKDGNIKERIEQIITDLLNLTEVDIAIKWKNGCFIPTGAELLDDRLINDPLKWLRDQRYVTVVAPFEKGIRLLIESKKYPDLLSDVITDMYEAIEALAKIITDRDKDLSANKELFLKNVKAGEYYRKTLSYYIEYANNFRHSAKEGIQKPDLSKAEVENFLYLTGIFIRLVIEAENKSQ